MTAHEEIPPLGYGPAFESRRAKRGRLNAGALYVGDLMSGLGSRTARGGLVTVSGQIISMVIQVASIAIMSRLLRPEDFGLVAMATAVTAFASVFVDLGLSTATVQRQQLNQDMVSALFFVNLGASAFVMLALCAAAPVAAHMLGDSRLIWVIIASAATIPITAAGAQHLALLNRRMRWMTVRGISLSGQLLGLTVGALLAWQTSLGYWALVASAAAVAVTNSALVWCMSPWRPTWVQDWRSARSGIGFGLHLTGANLIAWAARQLDNVLIGSRWGAAELGQYTRAYALYMLPVKLVSGPIRAAVVPALSRLQDQPDRWRRALLDIQGALFIGAGGITAILIATSDLLIKVLLGPQWHASIALFQILAASIPFMIVANTNGLIHISLGRTDRMLRWNLIRLPIVVGGFLIGLPYGAKGVALAVAIVPALLMLPSVMYAARGTPVSALAILRQTLSPALCIVVAVTATMTLNIHSDFHAINLIVEAAFCATLYAIGAILTILFDKSFASLRIRLAKKGGIFS